MNVIMQLLSVDLVDWFGMVKLLISLNQVGGSVRGSCLCSALRGWTTGCVEELRRED